MTAGSLEERRRRLLYRATHRGGREADLLFGGYVTRHLPHLDEAGIGALEEMSAWPEDRLFGCLLEERPPPAHAGLLRAIKERR